MDELTHEEEDVLKALLTEEGNIYDLPSWWDRTPPDARDHRWPSLLSRETLLAAYMNWSFTKRWAWDGLKQLLKVLRERGEPIPGLLQEWSNEVTSEEREQPRNTKAEQDARIVLVFRMLREKGYSRDAAMEKIADLLPPLKNRESFSVEGVKSAIRRAERDRPFQG